uniref:Uncharacterized protein n=3 Tax=Vibrionaceae TaxID=641 RepID=A0A0H3ZRU5_VIBSP|nr:hypothetical protein [Vibrio splendidus]AKN37915.1 hypothetical protein [Vibrio sp. FF_482]AKN37937.1 hypothetical protein [Enterovibrio norvegicus]
MNAAILTIPRMANGARYNAPALGAMDWVLTRLGVNTVAFKQRRKGQQ